MNGADDGGEARQVDGSSNEQIQHFGGGASIAVVAAESTAAAPLASAPQPPPRSPVAIAARRPMIATMQPLGNGQSQSLVYEVKAGQPTWSRLSILAAEAVAQQATRAVNRAIRTYGRSGPGCVAALSQLRSHLYRELPAPTLREVLDRCVAKDRLRCHHNPTDCLALELWRVFYSDKLGPEVSVVHHEFAFPKTSNYPEIVQNLDRLLCLMTCPDEDEREADTSAAEEDEDLSPVAAPTTKTTNLMNNATMTSFKLELKQCEVGFFVEDRLCALLSRLTGLRALDVPGLASDRLLDVIALYCTNLEVLGVRGAREQVTDAGFARFVANARCRDSLRQLDLSRCALTQQSLLPLQRLQRLAELRVSTTMLDDISVACDGGAVLVQADTGEPWGLESLALPGVRTVTVENDSYVQVRFIIVNAS